MNLPSIEQQKEIQVPQLYLDKSKLLTKVYDDFMFTAESLDKLVDDMRTLLIEAGFSKTAAMFKIAEDHKHLRSFSLKNLYKMLPNDKKRTYVQQPKLTNNNPNFSQTLKESNRKDIADFIPDEGSTLSELERFRKEKGQYKAVIDDDDIKHPSRDETNAELLNKDIPMPMLELTEEQKSIDLVPEVNQLMRVLDEKDIEIKQLKMRIEELTSILAKHKVEANTPPDPSKKFTFDYDFEIKDQILPFIVTVFPDKGTGFIRLRKGESDEKQKRRLGI